jgi:hypothetical protein
MDGKQISEFLKKDAFTSWYFQGFSMNDTIKLPSSKKDPALYILNTDKESGKGIHWCAAVFEGLRGEFFDPFGMSPQVYGFDDLLQTRKIKKIVYNTVVVQNLSSIVCGHHCLFYAYHRCRGYSLSDILTKYDPYDTEKNDAMVVDFLIRIDPSLNPN